MLIPLSELQKCDISATDGSIGDVHDIYFDDRYWIVRYVVVDTGTWLPGRKVLIGREALGSTVSGDRVLRVSLSKKEVEEGPGIAADLPVSRQDEIALRRYYAWPDYWDAYPPGMAAVPQIPTLRSGAALEDEAQPGEPQKESNGDPNLRSAREVTGYYIAARDGEVGHVEDLVIDDQTWAIRYIVVDTRNWLPGRKVLIAPSWSQAVDWADKRVYVDADKGEIKESPPYDWAAPLTRDYEYTIHEHYGRRPYWA